MTPRARATTIARPRNRTRSSRPAGECPDGWQALAEGRWEAARETFATALARAETPESLEGLSWAAWWLDDADTCFDARQRAFRLYRSRRDVASAARMATWLAADQLDFRGAFAVASGWLQRARRLIATLDPQPDHGWLAFHEGYVALRQGDTAQACERAIHATDLGRRFDVPDLEMLGLALEGSALVACGRVEEGMRRLDEATARARRRRRDPNLACMGVLFMVHVRKLSGGRGGVRRFAGTPRLALSVFNTGGLGLGERIAQFVVRGSLRNLRAEEK